jgi:hypothetical protein
METNEEIQPRPLPTWMSVPIILLCLIGGGWIIHWYLLTDALADETHILGDATTPAVQAQPNRRGPGGGGGGGGGWNLFGANNGVHASRDGASLILKARKATATASLNEGKHNLGLHYNDYKGTFPGDDMHTLEAARLLVQGNDKAMLTAMKLTDDQLHKLRGLSQPPEAVVSPTQKDEILTEFTVWQAAKNDQQKNDASEKLRQIVDDVAAKAVDATKVQIADRAKKINEIVTPEQWKISTQMGGAK